MTSYDPYQPERQAPARLDPAWQQYPPSAPLAAPQPQPYGTQSYPAQPYYPQQPYGMTAYPMPQTSGMAVAGHTGKGMGIAGLVCGIAC